MIGIKSLAKTTYYILPFLGLELYGLNVVIGMFIFFCFLALFDVTMGYYIAREYKVVSSSAGTKGFANKIVWVCLLAGLIAFIANMSHSIANEDASVLLSGFVLAVMLIRIGFEGVSVIENLAIMSNKRESKVLKRLAGLLMSVVGIGQRKLEEKLARYTSLSNDQDGPKQ